MKKKVLLLFISSLAVSLMISCGGGSGAGNEKYSTLNKTLTEVLSIVKANKDKPEEAKKQVKELMGKQDVKILQKEIDDLFKSVTAKMKNSQKQMKEKMKGKSPAEMGEMIKSMQEKAEKESKKIMSDGSPALAELMTLGEDPKYQKVMKAIETEMKALKP